MNRFVFSSQRLGFSVWTEEDRPLAHSLWGNREVMRLLSANGKYNESQINDRLHAEIKNQSMHGVQYWKLYELESLRFVGCCGLKPVSEDEQAYELGFQLLPEFWGKSFAYEASVYVMNYAFITLKASNIYAGHHPENVGSSGLLAKLGFKEFKKVFYEPTGLMHPFYSYFRTDEVKIDGKICLKEALPHSPHQLSLFLEEWFSSSTSIEVQTSGSTGQPKKMTVRKTQLLQSAKMTCDFFGLKPDDKALLCLPLEYIAGKMLVVRALYAGLDLYTVEPSGHPLATTAIDFDFAAMIPLQVYNSLQIHEERERLAKIKYLIIGGGAIDENLEKELAGFPNAIYSTYGMTETLSHIALRKINGAEASLYYTPLPNVRLSLSDEGTLIIDAPLVADETLITNDIAELRADGSFRILGRKDNVINSGGIKVQIEEVERTLRPHINSGFAISCIPHPKLGEAVVLLIEKTENLISRENIENILPRYQQPLHICSVPIIPLTGNGKPDRAAIKKLAEQICPASTHLV